ncbi:MAG: hypothetical protein ACM3XO_10320 [Bacteroidota bacterium]
MKTHRISSFIAVLIFFLAGCSSPAGFSVPSATGPGIMVTIAPTQAIPVTQTATAESQASNLPDVVSYDLGETTITQSIFPEDSRFRNMPVRLNGLIAVPDGEVKPHPVVVILHGNHPGCPIPEGDMVDRWPCSPELERPNFQGFEYLLRTLASQGYVGLSLNVNAEYTLGFGEPVPAERLGQLVDLHLKALGHAAGGGPNPFGVDLKGRADMSRLAFIGHSQGAEGAYWLIQTRDMASPDAIEKLGYGPVYGLLMVAPSANIGGAGASSVPVSVILPACDRDVINQEGQLFYELNRLDPQQNPWASSVLLERANHNYFNETLSDETLARPDRPDCEPLMEPETQQDFLSEYTIDFLTQIFDPNPDVAARLGMDFHVPAVDELYRLPVRIAALAPNRDRLPLLLPANGSELETNLAGGVVTAEGLTTLFCEEGHYVPSMKPGSEPCKRVNLVVPGNPAMVVVSWPQKGAAWHFSLPEATDLSQYSSISLRAALDPLSELNEKNGTQAFTIQLLDTHGNTASVQTRADEPALRFPLGNELENDTFEGGWFTGRVPLTSIRMPLKEFSGVDLTAIQQITLSFDQTPSGTLFISDLELVR